MLARTLFQKLWDAHVVRELNDGWSLLHVDLNLMHDLSGADAFRELGRRGLPVANPELAIATPDHAVSTTPGRNGYDSSVGSSLYEALRQGCKSSDIPFLEINSGRQGIVHVIGPEQGWVLPGMLVACGDSHTCTNGALGALAVGVGSSEVVHVLATQTLRLKRPRQMLLKLEGRPQHSISAKDIVLYAIHRLGVRAASGTAVEFGGGAIREMSMEGRLTICNMAVEMGARFGVIAPDTVTFNWLRDNVGAELWGRCQEALVAWRFLESDPGAHFDQSEVIDTADIAPMMTWGTRPDQSIPVDAILPFPEPSASAEERAAYAAAYDYMGLLPGQKLAGTPVDWVFIGSCSNSRLSDLRDAAAVVRGRQVSQNVRAWVVPGSEKVKRLAEAEGLDQVFVAAGFDWREPGCSLCAASNGERVPPLARCVSTSNRNFVGRQGPRARTHLASPASAAAAAIAGAITDVREWL